MGSGSCLPPTWLPPFLFELQSAASDQLLQRPQLFAVPGTVHFSLCLPGSPFLGLHTAMAAPLHASSSVQMLLSKTFPSHPKMFPSPTKYAPEIQILPPLFITFLAIITNPSVPCMLVHFFLPASSPGRELHESPNFCLLCTTSPALGEHLADRQCSMHFFLSSHGSESCLWHKTCDLVHTSLSFLKCEMGMI